MTEHDEGFKAGIEAAAKEREEIGWLTTAADIRALKPAPRSTEHTAKPSAQGQWKGGDLGADWIDSAGRIAGYVKVHYNNKWIAVAEQKTLGEYVDRPHAEAALIAALATAPSTRIEAEPDLVTIAREAALVHSGDHGYLPMTREACDNWRPHDWVLFALQTAYQNGYKSRLAPPDRTPEPVDHRLSEALEAVASLRAALRSTTDRLETLFDNGPPKPAGRSIDALDAHAGEIETIGNIINRSRAALEETKNV